MTSNVACAHTDARDVRLVRVKDVCKIIMITTIISTSACKRLFAYVVLEGQFDPVS